jgi:predicted MFS family arabinose efflux permease
MENRLHHRLLLTVFCPFAAGYFLSFFYRNVNAVISKDLAREFSLSPSDLGFLTATYMLTFAAIQLPLGVMLDRYGPRRVVAGLLCVAALGALIFALAKDFTMLSIGRALIGLGVSAGLMGAIKAFSLWFPLSRMATLNGAYLMVGGLGGLSATAPVELLLGPLGWRGLFLGLLVFFIVPEKKLPGAGGSVRSQFASFRVIFASPAFWRITLPLVICHSGYLSLQGLWLGPWLYDVAGLSRPQVGQHLLITALAYTIGSLFFGVASDRLAAAGVSRMTLFKVGMSISLVMFLLLAFRVQTGLWLILAVYGFCTISGALAYAVLTPLFAPELTGRLSTASNVLMFTFAFAAQWIVGVVLRLYPVVDGSYSPPGYTTAFLLLGIFQVAALAWLIPMKEPPADVRGVDR